MHALAERAAYVLLLSYVRPQDVPALPPEARTLHGWALIWISAIIALSIIGGLSIFGARTEWAVDQVKRALRASKHLGLKAHATFSGALAWPYVYPWPQRPAGLIETAFDELAKRWMPILDAFDAAGVNLCFELHPGEDLHDGVTFEMFLDRVGGHKRCNILYDPSHFVLQQVDYLAFIDIYHTRIKMFHVKDAEFHPSGRQGVYGGYQPWISRAGRFRSLGDGQVDFRSIFSKLAQYDFEGWAVLEWECCVKNSEQGAKEGAPFIAHHIIQTAERAFDDFARSGSDTEANRKMLGLANRKESADAS